MAPLPWEVFPAAGFVSSVAELLTARPPLSPRLSWLLSGDPDPWTPGTRHAPPDHLLIWVLGVASCCRSRLSPKAKEPQASGPLAHVRACQGTKGNPSKHLRGQTFCKICKMENILTPESVKISLCIHSQFLPITLSPAEGIWELQLRS